MAEVEDKKNDVEVTVRFPVRSAEVEIRVPIGNLFHLLEKAVDAIGGLESRLRGNQ